MSAVPCFSFSVLALMMKPLNLLMEDGESQPNNDSEGTESNTQDALTSCTVECCNQIKPAQVRNTELMLFK